MTEEDRIKFEKIKASGRLTPEQLEKIRKTFDGEREYVVDYKLLNRFYQAQEICDEIAKITTSCDIDIDMKKDEEADEENYLIIFKYDNCSLIMGKEKELFMDVLDLANQILMVRSADDNIYITAVFAGIGYDKKKVTGS